MTANMDISRAIRTVTVWRGKQQRDLAPVLGVTEPTVSERAAEVVADLFT